MSDLQNKFICLSSGDEDSGNPRKNKKIKKAVQRENKSRIGSIHLHTVEGNTVYYDVDKMRGDQVIGALKL